MKIRQYIEMEAVIHKRTIPSDLSEYMYELEVYKLPHEYRYFSKSADKYFSIFDLELHHFIRVFINKNSSLLNVCNTSFLKKGSIDFKIDIPNNI